MKKFAICFYGHIRTWNLCKENFTTNVIESLHPILPDIFVHTYDKNNVVSDIIHTEEEINGMFIFDLKSGETIIPKKIIVENNDKAQEKNKIESQEIGYEIGTSKTYSVIKKIKLSHDLMKEYEIKNNINYDYIMMTRPDMIFRNISFSPDILNIINNENCLYNFYSGSPDPSDEVVVGVPKMIEIYVSRYTQFYKIKTEHTFMGAIPTDCVHLLLVYTLSKYFGRSMAWQSIGYVYKKLPES
jgi:hypothetical protein